MSVLATKTISVCFAVFIAICTATVAGQESDPAQVSEDTTAPVVITDKKIRELIAQLGDDNFATRDRAQMLLVQQGEPLLKRLDSMPKEIAEAGRDPEVAWRIKAIRRAVTPQNMTGSTWAITYPNKAADIVLSEKQLTFLDSQVLSYDAEGNKLAKNSEWRELPEDRIVFSFNDRYAVYEGKRISATVYEGVANNVKDKTWKWKMTLVE